MARASGYAIKRNGFDEETTGGRVFQEGDNEIAMMVEGSRASVMQRHDAVSSGQFEVH